MIDRFDIYVMVDPLFRIHARLFRVQDAILRSSKQQVEASKRSIIARASVLTSMMLFLLTLVVQVFKVEWGSTPVVVLLLLGVLVLLIHARDYQGLKEAEKGFETLISDEGGVPLERWVDYAEATMAAYGTRLKLLARAEKELEEQHRAGQMEEGEYRRTAALYAIVREYCTQTIEYYKQANEKLYNAGERTREDYDEILRFVRAAEIGSQPEEGGKKVREPERGQSKPFGGT